jgi:hypothetical protein
MVLCPLEARASLATVAVDAYAGRSNAHDALTDVTDASKSLNISGDGGSSGSSSASIVGHPSSFPGGDFKDLAPSLHARASGTSGSANNDPNSIGGGGSASCSWNDRLSIDDETIVQNPLFYSLFATFIFHLDGTITGPGASASFGMVFSRFDANGNPVSYTYNETYDKPGTYGGGLRQLRVPLDAFIWGKDPNSGIPVPPQFAMGLTASGGSAYGPDDTWFGDGSADFGSTFALDTILISDANGNAVSGFENLHIIGDNGAYVMGPPVPEPCSGAALACALLLLAAGRQSKRSTRRRAFIQD